MVRKNWVIYYFQERNKSYIKFKTISIWTDINAYKDRFTNQTYDESKSKEFILTPSSGIYKLRFWEEYFLKYNPYYVMRNYDHLSEMKI